METANQTPFLQSLAIQARVIGALITQTLLTSNGRRNIGFLWLFLSPMVFTVVVGTFRSLHHSDPGPADIPWVVIATTGFSFLQLMRSMPRDCGSAIRQNRRLLLHRHVQILDLMFARVLLELVTVTVSLIVLTFACIFLGWFQPPVNLLEALIAWVLLAWFVAALGLTFGPFLERFPLLKNFMIIYTLSCMVLSGAIIPVHWVPGEMQEILLWVPSVHGMEMLREGYLGRVAHAHYDVSYLLSWTVFLTFLGLAFARASRVEAENE